MTDEDAILRTLSGDREAFSAIVNAYTPSLTALAYGRLGNVADAQDAVQETFVSAYRQLDKLENVARFAPWIYTILRNVCAMRFRADSREKFILRGVEVAEVASAADGPLKEAQANERAQKLREAVGRLTPALQEVVALRYIGGVGRRQAAEMLDITPDTLDKRHERALAELKRLLGE